MTADAGLSDFGIPRQVEHVWRHLVEHPRATTDDLLAIGLGHAELAAALTTLVKAKLIHEATSPSGYLAFDPSLAVQALVAKERQEIAERLRRLASSEAAITPLADVYARGRISAGIDRGLEIVISLEEVREHIAPASKRAQVEVRAIFKGITVGGIRDGQRRDPSQYRRGLVQRSIVDMANLADPEFYEAFAESSREGDQVRSMPDAPTHMLLFDEDLAVLPLNIREPAAGAMLIRERTLIDILSHMYEHYWREATPVYLELSDSGLATKRQKQVLELLAGGATDAAISRSLDVGVRTIRREVAELREHLGVNSRTEIVAAAIRRGWL